MVSGSSSPNGSTLPVTSTVTHAGLVEVKRFVFDIMWRGLHNLPGKSRNVQLPVLRQRKRSCAGGVCQHRLSAGVLYSALGQ